MRPYKLDFKFSNARSEGLSVQGLKRNIILQDVTPEF